VSAPVDQRLPWHRHPWVRHLRLSFNALLSPIYLWGAWSAPTLEEPWRVVLGWIALHVFLYGGTTALNTSIDRDEGPIGGMRHPDPVDDGLLRWSIAVQVAGVPLAWLVGPAFLVTYVVLGLLAAAYSLPATRWKSRTAGSLAVVALGQGGVGSLAGWWAAVGPHAAPGAVLASPGPWWAALAAGLLVVGQYVVSQAYQVDEDARRGDRTLPVLLGPRRALRLALVPAALGALVMVGTIALHSGWWWALPGALLGALVSVRQWRWSTRVGADLDADYAAAMGLVRLGGLGFGAYLLALLVAS
jgi:4-hydroxybenzoate polyprenyltransferase